MAVNSNWLSKPITDRIFQKIVNKFSNYDIDNGPWIAGGVIRKLWQGLKWDDADIDVFFKNKEQFTHFCKNLDPYLYEKCEFGNLSQPILAGLTLKSNPIASSYESSNACTFTLTNLPGVNYAIKIQAIQKDFYNSAEELLEDFDWTVCQLVSDGTTIWAPQHTVIDLSKRNLVLSPTTKRTVKLGRLMKYSAYGFKVSDNIMLDALTSVLDGTLEGINDDY